MSKEFEARPPELPSLKPQEGPHYVTPPTLNEGMKRERQGLRGLALAEGQLIGAKIATTMLERIGESREVDSIHFSAKVLAATGLCTAWYAFGKDSNRMNRQVPFPQPESSWTNTLAIYSAATDDFRQAKQSAEAVLKYTKSGKLKKRSNANEEFGRRIGTAAYKLSIVGLGNVIARSGSKSAFTNRMANERYSKVFTDVNTIRAETKFYPSLAQLADQHSPLSVAWQYHAPEVAKYAHAWAYANIS